MENHRRRCANGRSRGHMRESQLAMGRYERYVVDGNGYVEMLEKGSSNTLIAELGADLKARQTKPEPPQGMKDPEQCKEAALDHVRAVNDILTRKVKPEEADEFKKWLLAIGQRVAEAANEGGIVGFGGERVSDAEKNVLRQIAFELDQPAS